MSPWCHKRLPIRRLEVASRYEIVYKLRSFVDFGVPLIYNLDFALSRFPRPRSLKTKEKMGDIEERWDDPSKPAEFLGSAEEWHHARPSSGRRERAARPSRRFFVCSPQ